MLKCFEFTTEPWQCVACKDIRWQTVP